MASFMRIRRKRVPRELTPPQNSSTPTDKFRLKGQFHENKKEEGAEGTHSAPESQHAN
jgi:hypothetical protein